MTYTTVRAEGHTDAEAADGATKAAITVEPLRLFAPRVRGRHRRPRPRKVLLAAGGLALAAGVLSLVRLTPDSGVGGIDAAEAEPSADQGTDSDAGRSTNAAATIRKVPEMSPSSTSAMGGLGPSPTPDASLLPAPGAPASPFTSAPADAAVATPAPDSTTIPDTTYAPAPTATPRPPTATAPAGRPTRPPAPAPAPSRTTAPPAPGAPGLCVPIIGLCVDELTTPGN
ncbi:hypothetical protein OG985_18565 [Streptomyces sp. NBC_00289]|uniref:hypothetical protein n=1 Tax=Streptomyces sp. NBC_00289 TaxID=2975703 RepID=UPI003248EEFB